MAWANNNNSYNNFDMDSSDDTNAKKLVVRNSAATPIGAWRAEVLETDLNNNFLQALHVSGRSKLENTNSADALQMALEVTGKSTFDLAANQSQPVIEARGDIENVGHLSVRSVNAPEASGLWQAEISNVEETNRQALKVSGFTRLVAWDEATQQEVLCAGLTPNLGNPVTDTPPSIGINIFPAEPDVRIGYVDPNLAVGNRTRINGLQIGIGALPDTFVLPSTERVRIASPVILPATGDPEHPHNARLSVDGLVESRAVDYPDNTEQDKVLKVGEIYATRVELAHSGIVTQVKGSLTVDHATTLTGGVNGNLMTSGEIQAGTSIRAGGNITADGGSVTASTNVTANGQVRTNTIAPIAPVTAVTLQGKAIVTQSLTVQNALSADAGATINSGATVKHSISSKVALEVTHTAAQAGEPALKVSHNANGGQAIAANGESVLNNLGARALTVNGEAKFTEAVTFQAALNANGVTAFGNTVNLNGMSLIIGGSGPTETILKFQNNQAEFLVGGTRSCYIDSTGLYNG